MDGLSVVVLDQAVVWHDKGYLVTSSKPTGGSVRSGAMAGKEDQDRVVLAYSLACLKGDQLVKDGGSRCLLVAQVDDLAAGNVKLRAHILIDRVRIGDASVQIVDSIRLELVDADYQCVKRRVWRPAKRRIDQYTAHMSTTNKVRTFLGSRA